MTRLTYAIHCQYSGVQIATLDYMLVAGHMPYLSHWDRMVAMHPIFSLPQPKLLAFARSEWNRLAKASEDEQTTEQEDTLLRICFLAVLHSLDSIRQEAPSLPSIKIVQNNMVPLFKLSYWKYYLQSKRFEFPEFKINKFNSNDRFENIHHYLDACFKIKEDYENGVNELVEKEKIDAAERALKALRNSWIVPVSNKQLFRWVKANLPDKYLGDVWMETIFCGKENQILAFDLDELQMLEHIILGECPNGNAIMHAVRKRLDEIMQIYTDNKEAFTVDFSALDLDASLEQARKQSKAPLSLEMPKQSDFASKALFIRANALYYLQQRSKEIKGEQL